ncbi:MAG: hypothetical protein NC110_00435 [Ruminococcus sp.]|nr:hypothetical protein [Ruminococcus sp.]
MLKRKSMIPLVAIVLIFALACSAFAAAYLLRPSQVAQKLNEPALEQVFKDNATIINKTVKSGDYDITLIGIASGKNLVKFAEINKTKSYIVVAVSRTDGTKLNIMDNNPVSFTLVFGGIAPWQFNGFDLSFRAESFVENGTYYSLFCYDDISSYAENGLSIFAFDGELLAPSPNVFTFDSESGKTSYNANYNGIKAEFKIK